MPTSRLEVDLAALDRNLTVVRGVVGKNAGRSAAGASVCAVLKQDGYGVGAVRLAKRLVGTGGGAGVEMIAVYSLDEARAIVEAVANVPVLVLMPVTGVERTDPMYRQLGSGRIHLTVHSDDQFRQITEMAGKLGLSVPVHVQIDTGLSRGGAMPEAGRKLVERVLTTPRARLAGMMTHFASPCCDCEFTREQARLFRDFVEGIKPALKAAATTAGGWSGQELMLHASNSCATFRSKNYHGTMVRIGQALLGFALEDAGEDRDGFEFASQAAQLDPVVRWTTTVSTIGEIPAGWPVGYGRTWRAPWREDGRKTRIALIPVGYADGYSRALGGRGTGGPGWVGFSGRAWERRSDDSAARGPRPPMVYAPVVGRVSMDQITVDVTDVPDAYLSGAGRIGSLDGGPEVELMSPDRAAPNFWATMAAAGGSITHEQLCRVGPRVERVYRGAAAGAETGATRVEQKPAAMAMSAAAAPVRGPGEVGGLGGVAAMAG